MFGANTESRKEKLGRNCQNQHSLLPNPQDSLLHRPKSHMEEWQELCNVTTQLSHTPWGHVPKGFYTEINQTSASRLGLHFHLFSSQAVAWPPARFSHYLVWSNSLPHPTQRGSLSAPRGKGSERAPLPQACDGWQLPADAWLVGGMSVCEGLIRTACRCVFCLH